MHITFKCETYDTEGGTSTRFSFQVPKYHVLVLHQFFSGTKYSTSKTLKKFSGTSFFHVFEAMYKLFRVFLRHIFDKNI